VNDERSALDRFLAAVPYAIATLVVLALLSWQASIRKTPTIFGDELEWSQISRAIADTGHAARRGDPIGFKSLYPYVISPFWWIHKTSTAYSAIKYANTILMAFAAVPTYLIARMLVPKRIAFAAALATLCTTAFFYAPFILPEVAAFPMFALCAWITIRALARGGTPWLVAAAALDLAAPLVRGELVIVPATAAAAAAIVWLVGPQGRRLRRRWGVIGHVLAAIAAVAAFLVLNKLFGHHSHEWATVTHQWRDRMWTLGMEATSALALGLGLLPFLGGLASLWLPDRRADPAWRAFAAFTGAALVTTWTYTAVKAAYLSTVFATRVEERNMIYVQPLLIVGTAAWLCSQRRFLPLSLAAWAFTTWLVVHYGYQLDFPYFEAPGYGIAAMANRAFRWDQATIRNALLVISAVLLVVILLAHFLRGRRLTTAVLFAAAAGAVAMMLAGEVTSSRGSGITSSTYLRYLAQPPDWIDRASHGESVTYLGQDISTGDALGVSLMEFWNRDVEHVWSLDGSAPGPGPTLTPDLASRDGELTNSSGVQLVVTPDVVSLTGPVVAVNTGLTLRRVVHGRWALHEASYGVSHDGWITGSSDDPVARGRFAYFGPETKRGVLHVGVGRAGFCPADAPSAHVVIKVGPLRLNEQRAPYVRHAGFVRRLVVPNCHQEELTFSVVPPVAVEVSATPVVLPTDYNIGDSRYLGVQVGFSFTEKH
jgi:hypothetical protein